MKIVKRVAVFVTVSFFIYALICAVLLCWPVPSKREIKNYDYSSILAAEEKTPLGEEHWLTLRDATPLFYRRYPSSSKNMLLLLHGSGSESRYLRHLANFVAQNGLATVITPDLRGHGRTSKIKGDIAYVGQYDHDLEDVVRQLRTQHPHAKILLGGHSSGGGLALRYAGNKTVSPVDGYVFFAPYLGHEAPTVKPNSGDWVTVAIPRWVGLSMLNRLKVTGLNHLPVLFFNRPEEVNDSLQTDHYSYQLAVSYQPNAYEKDIQTIDKPNLVLVGDKDESFYPEQFLTVFEGVPNGYAKIIPGANHLDILNNQDARSEISTWLKSFQGNQMVTLHPF